MRAPLAAPLLIVSRILGRVVLLVDFQDDKASIDRHSVELKDTPEMRGMIHKVRHLVEVE